MEGGHYRCLLLSSISQLIMQGLCKNLLGPALRQRPSIMMPNDITSIISQTAITAKFTLLMLVSVFIKLGWNRRELEAEWWGKRKRTNLISVLAYNWLKWKLSPAWLPLRLVLYSQLSREPRWTQSWTLYLQHQAVIEVGP